MNSWNAAWYCGESVKICFSNTKIQHICVFKLSFFQSRLTLQTTVYFTICLALRLKCLIFVFQKYLGQIFLEWLF